jgi:hypothetical protein
MNPTTSRSCDSGRRTTDQPIHVRVPFERLRDGTIRFGPERLVANQEGDALN